MKVFGIGCHKTGTTTLEWILRALGYSPQASFNNSVSLIPPWLRGDYKPLVDFVRKKKFLSYSDSPWNHTDVYQILDARFLGSKFILTLRDPESWFDSMRRHCQMGMGSLPFARVYHFKAFGLPLDKELTPEYKDQYIEAFQKRNQEIQLYFQDRPDDLLVVDWTRDGMKKVGDFLGVSVADVPAPRFNKGNPNIFKFKK